MTSTAPHVLTAFAAVRAEIDRLGIAKEREVTDGVKFKFRGIDDVMNVFSGLLAKANLAVLPQYESVVVTERKTNAGKPVYNVNVGCTLTFTSLQDGSVLIAGPFYGEANDTGDKATAKAMSIAYRQGFLLTFVVPLGPAMDTETSGGDEPEDEVATAWIEASNKLQDPREYALRKAEMLAAYGGVVNNIPQSVKDAFNAAKARVTPKDEE